MELKGTDPPRKDVAMDFYTRYLQPLPSGGKWNTGVIVGRAWPADMPPLEYLLLLGLRGAPDDYTRDGAPVFRLSESQLAAAQRDLDRECLDRYEIRNIACNAGRSATLNYIGNTVGTGIQYFAVGNGTLPANGPTAGDNQLASEQFRKTPATVTLTGNQVLIATSFASGEANLTYTEAGLFGNGATGSANSGQMFAHSAYSYTKTASIVLTNDYFIYLN